MAKYCISITYINKGGKEMPNKITIFIAGDSTAAIKQADKRPETGWGEKFQHFFTDSVLIDNRAVNGRSTKSFIEEGRLAEIKRVIQPGDYLFIQFGHNDQKPDPDRGTNPYGDYQDNLSAFVRAARESDAYPVLLTSVARRKFIENQMVEKSVGEYPDAMKYFAKKHHIPLLDIYDKSRKLLNDFGKEQSKNYFLHLSPNESSNYPDGISDDTHFNEDGALAIARLVKEALIESELLIKNFLKKV